MRRHVLVLAAFAIAIACDTNPYDASQEPRVTVKKSGATLSFEWEPAGAHLVRVYRGATAGDGYSEQLMWSVAATSKNSISSPVFYGVVPGRSAIDSPMKLLVNGQTYTVEVTRADPEGKGDGFTNTSNRYVGSATFTR